MEALLRAVHRSESGRLADAARAARLPIPVATAIRRELEKRGILMRQHGLAFTAEGEEWISRDTRTGIVIIDRNSLTPQPRLSPELDEVVRAMEVHLATAPQTDVTLDQAPCAAETAVRRVALLYRSGALEGRRIALLGDDDLVALAIGLFGRLLARKELPKRLVVFEIDPRRVEFWSAARAMPTLRSTSYRTICGNRSRRSFWTHSTVLKPTRPTRSQAPLLFVRRGVELLERGRG